MDASNSGYSYFASANFEELSINKETAGLFTNSDNYISMTHCIENLKNIALNLIEEEYNNRTDKESDVHTLMTFSNIKSRLVSLGCAGHLQQIESFLRPLESQKSFEKLQKICDELKSKDFNIYNTDIFRDVAIDINDNSFFKELVGFELDDFRTALQKIATQYSETYIELFEAENSIKNRLDKFEELSQQLNTILALETNTGSLELFSGLTKYLSAFFKEQKIFDYFNKFTEARKRFIVFRNLLTIPRTILQKTDVDSESPLCIVCMNDPVTIAFGPCGHTFCNFCSNKTLSICHICRTKIQTKLKLYFS